MNATDRQSRVRRPPSRKPSPGDRPDLTERLRGIGAPLRRRLGRADVLAEVIRAVNASLDPTRVADAMVVLAAEWLPISGWLVAAGDGGGGARTIAVRALAPAAEAAARSMADWVLRTGRVCASADLASDSRIVAGDVEVAAAALGFPLECRGRTIGALIGIDRAPATRAPQVSAATLAVLRAALEPGAIALDNALRMARAESLSVTDDLTQLYNSRYLAQVLRRETKRAARHARPLSLLFIDLDGFKGVNDAHGHLLGSRALVEAATVIRGSARETDIVARFGGDEFALVLPDTGSEGAMAVASRVRELVAAHHFLQGEGLDIRLTVSVGVATLADGESSDGLLQAADGAMYRVKDHGKDGIHVAGSDGPRPGSRSHSATASD